MCLTSYNIYIIINRIYCRAANTMSSFSIFNFRNWFMNLSSENFKGFEKKSQLNFSVIL